VYRKLFVPFNIENNIEVMLFLTSQLWKKETAEPRVASANAQTLRRLESTRFWFIGSLSSTVPTLFYQGAQIKASSI